MPWGWTEELVNISLTIPSVSFPDLWSSFITIATRRPGLILIRCVKPIPLIIPFLSSPGTKPGRDPDQILLNVSARFLRMFPDWLQKIFQSVKFDFIKSRQQRTNFSRRKTLLMEPYQVSLRQITQDIILVSSERHPYRHQLKQYFRIERGCVLVLVQNNSSRHSFMAQAIIISPQVPHGNGRSFHLLASIC